MSHHDLLLAQLRETLTQQRYSPVVIRNYCHYAGQFLSLLEDRKIGLEAVTPETVSSFMHLAAKRFRVCHGRPPSQRWTSVPRSGIHRLLKLARNSWPPEPTISDTRELLYRDVCNEYCTWLREERGLAAASIEALLWEARSVCAWYRGRTDPAGFLGMSIQDIDAYFETRARGLRRRSLKDVAERLRSFLRHLHRTGRVVTDLASRVIAPSLYAYETIPSVLSENQIAAVLQSARRDRSPLGLRDFVILRFLATYGLRAGEVTSLELNDINWRAETLSLHHSKTGIHSLLPLMKPVGESLIQYLRSGRPKTTDIRTIFIRARAPYRPLSRSGIYCVVRRRMEAAGVKPSGKRGPHIFRHARAVSMLRASIPQKIIGDVLGHRSTEATIPYLKLATEDLRAIALEIPGQEVRP